MKTVLVTGGHGFLGRAVARKFKQRGMRVVGIGRGRWAVEEARAHAFDVWLDAGVTLSSLMTLEQGFDVVVHCAGNGSVGYSLSNPLQDFHKTVAGTADLLEFLRLRASPALLIYPSSAAVYGACADAPIVESAPLRPISPYGVHKKVVEELLESYARTYGTRVAIVRFFSLYGPGLTKQLLWDASSKLCAPEPGAATFWGTGEETRDWLYGTDAAELVWCVAQSQERFMVLNGASGTRTTVLETIELLNEALDTRRELSFNNIVRDGDPRFYHADVSRAKALGWHPSVALAQGVRDYVDWLRVHRERSRD